MAGKTQKQPKKRKPQEHMSATERVKHYSKAYKAAKKPSRKAKKK